MHIFFDSIWKFFNYFDLSPNISKQSNRAFAFKKVIEAPRRAIAPPVFYLLLLKH